MSGAGKALKKATNILTGGILADQLTEKPDIKAAPEPKVAPVLDDKERERNAARKMQRKYGASGRASTMLSDSGLG